MKKSPEVKEAKPAPQGARCSRFPGGTTPARLGSFARVPFEVCEACGGARLDWADRALLDLISGYLYGVHAPAYRDGLPTSYRELARILGWSVSMTGARVERLLWRRVLVRRPAPDDRRGQHAYRYAIGHPSGWRDADGLPLDLPCPLPEVADGNWCYLEGDAASILTYGGHSPPVLVEERLSPEPADNPSVHDRLHLDADHLKGTSARRDPRDPPEGASDHTRASDLRSEDTDPRSSEVLPGRSRRKGSGSDPVDGLWIDLGQGRRLGLLDAIAERLDGEVPGWDSWRDPSDVPAHLILDLQERIARIAANGLRLAADTVRSAVLRAAVFSPLREARRAELIRVQVAREAAQLQERRAHVLARGFALAERAAVALQAREIVRSDTTPAEWRALDEDRRMLIDLLRPIELGELGELGMAEAVIHAIEHVDRLDVIEDQLAQGEPLQATPAEGMIPPSVGVPDIAAQGGDRGPSADPGDVALWGACPSCQGRERCPQGVPPDPRVEPGPLRGPPYDLSYGPPAHPPPDSAPSVDPFEQGPILPIIADPGQDGAHRAGRELLPGEDRHDVALPLLVDLARPDRQLYPLFDLPHVAQIEGRQLGSPEAACDAQEQDRPIAGACETGGARVDHGAQLCEGEWARDLDRARARLEASRPAQGCPDDRRVDG